MNTVSGLSTALAAPGSCLAPGEGRYETPVQEGPLRSDAGEPAEELARRRQLNNEILAFIYPFHLSEFDLHL